MGDAPAPPIPHDDHRMSAHPRRGDGGGHDADHPGPTTICDTGVEPTLVVERRSAVGAAVAELAIIGTLGIDTVGSTAAMLDWLGSQPASTVRLDLSGVDFLDARGVTLLLGIHALLQGSGRSLHLLRPSGVARRVLELCGASGLLTDDA